MTKTEVIKLFGGPRRSVREAARQLGFSRGTIHAWPDRGPIPRGAEARVLVAMLKQEQRHG